jgi:ribose 5-phosphate isomerase B
MEQKKSGKKLLTMKIGIASDHGGFELKQLIKERLSKLDYTIVDFGNDTYDSADDYPDYVIPLAKSVASGEVERGIAVCGSGVGASIAANKVTGARAALINDYFAAHQGVEDDDMNVLCLGGRITGVETAMEFTLAFLNAKFLAGERHLRRLRKADPSGMKFLK